jgi:hypothetical protein
MRIELYFECPLVMQVYEVNFVTASLGMSDAVGKLTTVVAVAPSLLGGVSLTTPL